MAPVKANGGVNGLVTMTTTLKEEDSSAGHDSRRSSMAGTEGSATTNGGGRVKYRRTRSVGRAEDITKEENKQRRSQPDKP